MIEEASPKRRWMSTFQAERFENENGLVEGTTTPNLVDQKPKRKISTEESS